jgi:hypothetical protein
MEVQDDRARYELNRRRRQRQKREEGELEKQACSLELILSFDEFLKQQDPAQQIAKHRESIIKS